MRATTACDNTVCGTCLCVCCLSHALLPVSQPPGPPRSSLRGCRWQHSCKGRGTSGGCLPARSGWGRAGKEEAGEVKGVGGQVHRLCSPSCYVRPASPHPLHEPQGLQYQHVLSEVIAMLHQQLVCGLRGEGHGVHVAALQPDGTLEGRAGRSGVGQNGSIRQGLSHWVMPAPCVPPWS